jgi:ABC-2 type transport system ATP-binding protein
VKLLDVKNKKVKHFSYGMRQRLGLAQALMTAKTFLMLDEPFLGLDPIGKDIVKNAIVSKAKEHNMAVLFSSHDLEDVADICDTVVMIKQGRCTFNGPMQRSRLYTVQIDNIPDGFIGEASKMGVEFLSDNILKFQPSKADKYSIDDLLKLIYTCNMHVVDIWVEELSLKNLFMERDV